MVARTVGVDVLEGIVTVTDALAGEAFVSAVREGNGVAVLVAPGVRLGDGDGVVEAGTVATTCVTSVIMTGVC